eukprot:gene8538-9450_t
MDENQIHSITRNAIESINQLAELVRQSSQQGQRRVRPAPAAESTPPIAAISSPIRPAPAAGPSATTTSAGARTMTRVSNALTELQRRFPTTRPYSNPSSSRSGSQASSNSSGLHSRPHPPGRPAVYLVTRDVIIMNFDSERLPSKSQKPKLEQERRVISGSDVDRRWNAIRLHEELGTLLPEQWMVDVGFEIVKNSCGSLVKPNIPRNKSIDSNLLFRSIAPSGAIYMRLLAGKPFDDNQDNNIDFEIETISMNESDGILNGNENSNDEDFVSRSNQGNTEVLNSKSNEEGTQETQSKFKCSFAIQPIINKIKEAGIIDPIETLKILQKDILQGRPLDLAMMEDTIDGECSYITVDRENILTSTFSELQYVENLRYTLHVDFMGEQCVDLGGPRKEWIRMMNHAIKEKYFDHGLREMLAEDYYYVGIMIAVALLQNGQLPVFMEENITQHIISTSLDQCIIQLQRGLEMLGMYSAFQQLPMLCNLLRPGAPMALNVQKLLQLLQARFSEEGSNSRKHEKECYQMFIKYIREVASGRRSSNSSNLTLGDILSFVTGATEEPPLGFQMQPAIQFICPTELQRSSQEGEASFAACFAPTARTCVNVLCLPRGTLQFSLPSMEKLFALYDEVFSQKFFGVQ